MPGGTGTTRPAANSSTCASTRTPGSALHRNRPIGSAPAAAAPRGASRNAWPCPTGIGNGQRVRVTRSSAVLPPRPASSTTAVSATAMAETRAASGMRSAIRAAIAP